MKIEDCACVKVDADGLDVEFGVEPCGAVEDEAEGGLSTEILKQIELLDVRLSENRGRIDNLNVEIDRLTNHADGIDYSVAVGCGLVCGLIDSFFVGPFDFKNAKAWSNKAVNEKISEFAKKHGYDGGSKRLKDHVAFLERKYQIPSDNLWSGKGANISAMSHHLDDFAHHPTPVGWICSIITQFTGKSFFANRNGESFSWDVERQELIGGTIPEKFAAGTINWIGHLVSDMAGSNSTAGAGMGLPGPIMSIAKELSQLPGIRNTSLPKLLNDVFTKEKFDLRTELAVAHELGRQAIPVIINETLVRLFYFFRRLVQEWRAYGFAGIHWKNVLPFRNRTIVRMLTIATGTFTAVDLADAGIRSAIKTGGQPAAFFATFVLHVNFVGVGRFAIACVTDIGMGIKLGRRRWERIVAMNERLLLLDAKTYLKQAQVWQTAKGTAEEVQSLCESCALAYAKFAEAFRGNVVDINAMNALRNEVERNNPGLNDELLGILNQI